MLLEELANELVEVTSSLVGGRTINIMNTSGVIIASTEHHQIGSFHPGAMEAIRTGKVVNIYRNQPDCYPGCKEGCNMPLRVNGNIIGVVSIFGDPDQISDIAHLLEVYATKYYQLESLLQPRLAEATMRSRLLMNLLSPTDSSMSGAHALMEGLNIHFHFPLYTVVISSGNHLSLPEYADPLYQKLKNLSFLRIQYDVWGIVDERMVLICSSLESRDIYSLDVLTQSGYRVSLGSPCDALWQIQNAHDQAMVLDFLPAPENFRDISDTKTRCRYTLSRTAGLESEYLKALHQKLLDAFGQEGCSTLLESILCYYENGKSVSAASNQLFIHKNTLQYRVRQVLETLQIDNLSSFMQEYLVRLLIGYIQRISRY